METTITENIGVEIFLQSDELPSCGFGWGDSSFDLIHPELHPEMKGSSRHCSDCLVQEYPQMIYYSSGVFGYRCSMGSAEGTQRTHSNIKTPHPTPNICIIPIVAY